MIIKFLLIGLAIILFISCGVEPRENLPPEKPYCTEYIDGICVRVSDYSEHSFCTYYLSGLCVIEDNRFVRVDREILVWAIYITEEHVNIFYPGLDLYILADEEKLKLHYKQAGNNQYAGTYSDIETKARVWLRSGDEITARMKCIDKYYIAMHEFLHFIHMRYIDYEYTGDPHMIPYLFIHWESQQAMMEGRTYDRTNTAEGLIYYDISNKCGYEE